jgi:RNA polymerase sigma-70 factor (ECF subfamily)
MTRDLLPVVAADPKPAPRDRAVSTGLQAHRGELYRFVLKRVRDAAAAEDIVQEVLVKAYTQQGTLKEPSKLRSWLYQIVRNTISDHYRGQKTLEPVLDHLPPPGAGEETEQAQRELAGCLVPLLDELPESYRRALQLAEIEGVTQQEVASRLGLSLSGAKSRVQRARKMLREALLNCCQVERDNRGAVVSYETLGGCDCCGGSCGT